MSAFLRYIVTQTLNGDADRIKAYSVGVDALGKPDTFDAQNDPSVRVLALRLRRTLDEIYAAGAPAHAIVALRVGTYVPEFFKIPTETSGELASKVQDPDHGDDKQTTRGEAKIPEPISPVFEAAHVGVSEHSTPPGTKTVAANASVSSLQNKQPEISGVTTIARRVDLTSGPSRHVNGKYLLVIALLLLPAIWQLGGSHGLNAKVPDSDLTLGYAFVEAENVTSQAFSPVPGDVTSTIPTLYLDTSLNQSKFRDQSTSLLRSSFIRAGTVNLVKQVLETETHHNLTGSYQLIMSELTVKGQSRLEKQVVSLETGEVLVASTLTRNNSEHQLTETEFFSIKSFATFVASKSGPVYQDYCLRHSIENATDCLSS